MTVADQAPPMKVTTASIPRLDARDPTRWRRGQRWKNDVIVWLVRAALFVAARVSVATLVRAGRAIGAIAWVLARAARKTAIENVVRAGLPVATARGSFLELGALLGDTVALLRKDHRAGERLAFAEGSREALKVAIDEGRGVVLVTAHHGAWERLASLLVEEGFPLTTPVRPSYDPRLDALVHRPLRNARGVAAIDRDAATTPIALVRALKAGTVVGFLVDVSTRVASIEVPFFGWMARTPIAPARLALRTGAAVVVAMATKRGVKIERLRGAMAPCAADDAAVRRLVCGYTERIEATIREEPTRWIWMSERWRAGAAR